MFSSNQVLEVSGCLTHTNELRNALEFALKASGNLPIFTRPDRPTKCVYQITDKGSFCIGWSPFDAVEVKKGWNEFHFDFDLDIISAIIIQHLQKQELQSFGGDGSSEKGFLMKCIETDFDDENDEGVKNSFYGIVEFRPFTCYYAK